MGTPFAYAQGGPFASAQDRQEGAEKEHGKSDGKNKSARLKGGRYEGKSNGDSLAYGIWHRA
jgi:hypothetical protein